MTATATTCATFATRCSKVGAARRLRLALADSTDTRFAPEPPVVIFNDALQWSELAALLADGAFDCGAFLSVRSGDGTNAPRHATSSCSLPRAGHASQRR